MSLTLTTVRKATRTIAALATAAIMACSLAACGP